MATSFRRMGVFDQIYLPSLCPLWWQESAGPVDRANRGRQILAAGNE